jgi:PBP1b-binding outer membrane lipoprotein LpoB
MKQMIMPFAAFALLLGGCSDSCCPPESHSTNSPASNSMVAASQAAVKTVDTTALNKAINLFQVSEGKFPADLDELVAKKFIPAIPLPPAGSKIVYDVTKGVVTVEKL